MSYAVEIIIVLYSLIRNYNKSAKPVGIGLNQRSFILKMDFLKECIKNVSAKSSCYSLHFELVIAAT